MGFSSGQVPKTISKRFCVLLCVASGCLWFLCRAALADESKQRRVLVLYPDADDGRPGAVLVDRGIRSMFASCPEAIEVCNEHLDISRTTDADYQTQLADFLRRKYEGRKIDVVIAGLTTGLDFAIRHRERAFPGVPVLFCAVDERELNAREVPADISGVATRMDLAGTLDVALRFHPTTKRVYVISGKAKFDMQWEAEARRVFHPYENDLQFIFLSGLALPELLKQVEAIPEESVVYYLHVFEDGDGKILIPAEVLEQLAAHAHVPIYGHVDTYVGRGIVGGRVFSFEGAGKDAAAVGLRILAGERPANIGIQASSANSYVFDWRQLQRWGISEAALPPGSVLPDYQPSFWELYRWHIVGAISLCIVEGLLIVGLLVQRASRRRAENRFRQAVEAAPTGMLLVRKDGRIALVNAHVQELFGYRPEELLDQPVEMLLPDRMRGAHVVDRQRFFAAPEARPMGAGRELFGRRKDGSEVAVEIGLSPVRTDMGLCVLASIVDVTQRKRAELALRESEQRFRLMADTAPVMIWISGPDQLCIYFNKPWLDFTGRALEREMGDGWAEGVHPDDLQRCLQTYRNAFEARQEFRMDYRLRRHDGVYRWILDTGVPRLSADGSCEGYVGSCLDVTEQKVALDGLRQNQIELRDLTGKLLVAQEAERRRIARELHDDLSQSLALLAVQLDLVRRQPPATAAQLGTRVQELLAKVKALSSAVHTMSHQLHPAKLEQVGLVPAVISLCRELSEAHGVTIVVRHDRMPEALSNETALCLYRIVQESLQNVVKHARAHQAAVELIGDADSVRLRVSDDGKGFDANSSNGTGNLGLVSMRERLRLVDGQIAIESGAAGTRIEVVVPNVGGVSEKTNLKAPTTVIG